MQSCIRNWYKLHIIAGEAILDEEVDPFNAFGVRGKKESAKETAVSGRRSSPDLAESGVEAEPLLPLAARVTFPTNQEGHHPRSPESSLIAC